MTEQEFRDIAEQYIDSAGLDNAVHAIAEVARAKADYLDRKLQYRATANEWMQAAYVIDEAGLRAPVLRASGRTVR